MSRNLEDLTPEFRRKVRRFIKEHLDIGVKLVVLYTHRIDDEQIALYAQGRRDLKTVNGLRKVAGLPPIGPGENEKTVTNADGIVNKSKHQTRQACDLWYARKDGRPDWSVTDPVRIKAFGAIAKRLGMKWGGDFVPLDENGIGWDPSHLEDV